MSKYEASEDSSDDFLKYLNSPEYKHRKDWGQFRTIFANHTPFRIFLAMVVGTTAFFYPLFYLIDEWGYEGGLQAVFLWIFAPVLSYLLALVMIPLHFVLQQIKPFRNVWTWLGPNPDISYAAIS